MASKTMPGIINYKATCKQCEWVFESDSTAKVQSATRAHRKHHWKDSPFGRLEENRRMREFYFSKRQEYARTLERVKEELDTEIRFLTAANNMMAKRDQMMTRIDELRREVELSRKMFDIADQKWSELLR